MFSNVARAIFLAALLFGVQLFGVVEFQQATGLNLARAEAAPVGPVKGKKTLPLASIKAMSGRLVLISYADNPSGDLFVINGDGSGLARVTETSLQKDNPSISKDGLHIVFTGNSSPADPDASEIYTVNADGTNLRQLTTFHDASGHPAWSPDGTRIVYSRGAVFQDDLWIMNADGTGQRQLTSFAGGENDADFMPDGHRVVFKSTRWTGKEQIAVMDLATGQVTRLTTNTKSDHDPIPTPDGQWVLFERYQGPGDWWEWNVSLNQPWDIVAVAADGSGRERVLFSDGGVNWLPVPTPDGQNVLWVKATLEGIGVAVVGFDGSNPQPLIGVEAGIGYLDWK
ncbi:MAG: hypothetical protein M1598_05640 [Actinobacteria bacterium]|nr:hypothetical protein [Actinomycetota bacterium]